MISNSSTVTATTSSGQSITDVNLVLHPVMINYITKKSRLFKMDWYSIWRDFCCEHKDIIEANFKYQDLDLQSIANDVRIIFLTKILPNIFTYVLTEEQKNYLKLLNNDGNFLRTENGFKVRTIPRYYLEKYNLTDDDLTWYTEMESISPNQQTLFVNLNEFSKLKSVLERSPNTQQILSFAYANEDETKNKAVLSMNEIILRIIEHKKNKTAPNNINNLVETLETIKEEDEFLKALCKWVEEHNSN